MGITGLLPLLKSIHKPCNLKKFHGQTIGIDAYGWLHRGTVSCATELALGQNSTKFVDFAMHRVRMLIYFGVTPYLVFDGANIPSKAATESERAERRKESRQRGLSLYQAGRSSQAHQELQKAVDVTPEMARQLIEELKRMKVQYIVAPYEADAQLAYLERKGIVNGILSEDSDLLVFGVKRLLTKLDQHGDCVEINRSDFTACRDISLIGWTDTDFRCMAILSGCDYLPSINKMGLKTAYRYVRKHKNIEKVLRMLSFDGQFCVPAGYLEKFRQAELTFLHHRVFCPITQKAVMLTDLGRDTKEEDLHFLGEHTDAETAIGVACGDLHPTTKEPMATSPHKPVFRGRNLEPRRVTVGSTADLKGNGRPIDAWFKPRRVPLAELDPNSLCYSPSSIRAMESSGDLSVRAEATSSTRQARRSTSNLPDNSTTSSSARSAERTSFLARAATMSTYRSPKRQRLCSEGYKTSPVAKKTSPFFASTEQTNSIRQKRKFRKSTDSDFGIYSDDSIEEVLKDLPDVDHVKSSKLTIFVERSPKSGATEVPASPAKERRPFSEEMLVPQSSLPQNDSVDENDGQIEGSETSSRSSIDQDPVDVSQSTNATSISPETDPEIFDDMVNAHTNIVNQRLRDRFSHRPSVEKVNTRVASRATEMVKIGQAAIQEKLAQTVSDHDTVEPLDKQAQDTTQHSSTVVSPDKPDFARDSMSEDPARMAIAKDDGNQFPSHETVPSEDLIVPNSEDDGEDLSESELGIKPQVLDLGRFAFKPTQT